MTTRLDTYFAALLDRRDGSSREDEKGMRCEGVGAFNAAAVPATVGGEASRRMPLGSRPGKAREATRAASQETCRRGDPQESPLNA